MEDILLTQAWLPCVCHLPHAWFGDPLPLWPSWNFLIFGLGVGHFHFALGPASYITGPILLLVVFIFLLVLLLLFFWPRPWHAEVPEPGTKPERSHGSSDDARSLTPGLPGNSLFSYLLNFKGSHFSKLKNSIPHRIKTNTDIYYLLCTFRRALMSTVVHKLQHTPHMANP